MSKANIFKTKDKKVLEARDKDCLKLISEFKKNGEVKDFIEFKEKNSKLVYNY